MDKIERGRLLKIISKRLEGTSLLEFVEKWHEKQLEIYSSDKPYIFLMGGNGSGKTTVGSYWLVTRALGFCPATGKTWKYSKRPDFYAIGPDYPHVERVMMPAVRQWIPRGELKKEYIRDHIWELKNGHRIIWKSGDSGADKFQGDEMDAAWGDEERAGRDKEIWDEVMARTFRRNGQVLVTMTPWQGTRWLHNFIFSPDSMPSSMKAVIRMALDENPYYLDHPEMLERAHKQWKGVVKQVRFYGHFHLLAGHPVFTPKIREGLQKKHQKTPVAGYLDDKLKFVTVKSDTDDPRAWLRIIQPPRAGGRYVCGVDVGGGNPTGDYHAAVVLDRDTGEQVAIGHTRSVEPRHWGNLVYQLATVYHKAFTVVEANNHGISVLDRLIEMNYGNLYMRTITDKIEKLPTRKYGFWTDSKSKQPAVDMMVDLVHAQKVVVHDPLIYAEMFHYYWLRETRQGAHGVGNENSDGHDDLIMALVMACKGMETMGYCLIPRKDIPEVEDKVTWEQAITEDVANAQLTEDQLAEFSDDAFEDTDSSITPFENIGQFD